MAADAKQISLPHTKIALISKKVARMEQVLAKQCASKEEELMWRKSCELEL